MDSDVASHSIFQHMQDPVFSGSGDIQEPWQEKKSSGMGQVGSVNPTGAEMFPLEPGGPQGSQEDPTTHTMAESLLQLWHTQECFAPTTPCPPSHLGAHFPLDLSARKELSSYRLVWIWARYLKIQGWEGKGEV